MTTKDKKEMLAKLNLVLLDINMLKNKEWEPDEISCNATISNIKDIIKILKK